MAFSPHVLPQSFLCIVSAVLIFFMGGCVGSKADAQEKNNPIQIKDTSQETEQSLPVLELTDLSDEAKSIYAILLCEQAFRNEDEGALIEATGILLELKAPVQTWMEVGLWLLERKSDNSVFFLEQAHTCWPQDTSLLMLYAEALKEKGALDEAIARVRKFIAKNPAPDAKLELATLLISKKKFGEAEALLRTITKQDRIPLVDMNLGKALAGLNRFEEAIPHFQRAHKGLPDHPEPLLELGKIYENLGQTANAIQTYENVLKTDFPSKSVLLKLINLSLQIKKPEKALRYLDEAPNDIPFRLIVADMFIDAKNYLQASNILRPIIEEPDAPVEAYLLLADLTWEHMRDLNAALDCLNKMPVQYQKSSTVLLLKVHLFARADKKKEAVLQALEGKRLFPDETKFWEAEARILTSEGKMTEALAVMRAAVKKWPNDMGMLFLMGNILDESGDKKAAFQLMEQIIERQPDNFQALNYVGYTLADADREIDRAIKLLERAIHLAPDRAYIVDSLAWAYFRAGRQNDALREIRRAVKLASKLDPAIWEHYGDIARRAGLVEESRDAYTKALEMEPENAEELRQKIAQ
ncbi:MAG: tetratricopeptide repeat protein [Desulfovibrionaceae bacterium]|nr:tetratricopeptide repeat protein [Desulfovibrionaceae bacterium]